MLVIKKDKFEIPGNLLTVHQRFLVKDLVFDNKGRLDKQITVFLGKVIVVDDIVYNIKYSGGLYWLEQTRYSFETFTKVYVPETFCLIFPAIKHLSWIVRDLIEGRPTAENNEFLEFMGQTINIDYTDYILERCSEYLLVKRALNNIQHKAERMVEAIIEKHKEYKNQNSVVSRWLDETWQIVTTMIELLVKKLPDKLSNIPKSKDVKTLYLGNKLVLYLLKGSDNTISINNDESKESTQFSIGQENELYQKISDLVVEALNKGE